MSKVFVSYKREDRPRIEQIAEILTDLGLNVWFDRSLASGEDWRRVIDQEIEVSTAMLVCWTSAAVISDEVRREVGLGAERGILAPVFLQRCNLPPEFSGAHAPDLSEWNARLDDPEWQSLLRRLEDLEGVQLRSKSLERAAGQDTSYVLRELLVRTAGTGDLLDYEEARQALQAELEKTYQFGAPKVTHPFLFGALDATAHENRMRREPPLCSLVVNKRSTGMPGRGYFQKHGFLEGESDPLAKGLFQRHLERVRAWRWTG